MWSVSIIRSIDFPEQEYVGATADLKRRLPEHNASKSAHTAPGDGRAILPCEDRAASRICADRRLMLNGRDVLSKPRKKRPR